MEPAAYSDSLQESKLGANQLFVQNPQLHCQPNDSEHQALNGMSLALSSPTVQGPTIPLDQISPTKWTFSGILQLPVNMSEIIFTAKSERVGVIGCVQLTRLEIGSLVEGMTDTQFHLVANPGLPTLALSFGGVRTQLPDNAVMQQPPSQALGPNNPLFLLSMIRMVEDDNPAKPAMFHVYGHTSLDQFRKSGVAHALDQSVWAFENAMRLVSPEHPRYGDVLYGVGVSHFERYLVNHQLSEINRAIDVFRIYIDSRPDEYETSKSWLESLDKLGLSYVYRFERGNDLEDFNKAVSALQEAIDLSPPGHRNLPGRLNNLSTVFTARFERNGDRADIEEALSLQLRTHALVSDNPIWLSNLGSTYLHRFLLSGEMKDVDNAIAFLQKAINLTPEGDTEEAPTRLNNMGSAMMFRFERSGNLADINEGISHLQKAIALVPGQHPQKHSWLNGLGSALLTRFESGKDAADIDLAISSFRESIDLTSDDNPYMSSKLNNLGMALMRRFQYRRDVADIDEAILVQRKALENTSGGSGWAISLTFGRNNLSLSLMSRFNHTRDINDINEAILLQTKVIETGQEGHPKMSTWLTNLGGSYYHRFESTKNLEDIDNAITFQQKSVDLSPEGHAKLPAWMDLLGQSFWERYQLTGNDQDLRSAVKYHRLAATSPFGPPSRRLEAAHNWTMLCYKAESVHDQSLEAYKVAVELLSQVAGMEQTVQKRHASLIDHSSLSTAAAAAAFQFGKPEMALEWLEQGRCLVWNQLNSLRTPVDNLRAHDRNLAEELVAVSRALENAGSRVEMDRPESKASSPKQRISTQDEVTEHVKLAQRWGQLLAKVREIPGFENFLRPPSSVSLLSRLPPDGPVVIINCHPGRCDALLLIAGRDTPYHVPLNNLSFEMANNLRIRLRNYLSSYGVRARGEDDLETRAGRKGIPIEEAGIRNTLKELWIRVIEPIALGLKSYGYKLTKASRIWWCATGPLAFLPIHAAGIYESPSDGPPTSLPDLAISSYTPTVSSLLDRAGSPPNSGDVPGGLLMISQSNTPDMPAIPATKTEIKSVQVLLDKHKISYIAMEDEEATLAAVLVGLKSNASVHLACHAIQDTSEPLRSGFYLHDGRLELAEIMKKPLPKTQLAFLSACQTSAGNERLSEEAVHLAAGMLAAGYRGVVATMWSIQDKYGPVVAKDFYDSLMSGGLGEKDGDGGHGDNSIDSTGSARSLHFATTRLRDSLGTSEASFLAWVPYVHIGF